MKKLLARLLCRLRGHRPASRTIKTQRYLIESTRCERCGRSLEVRGEGRPGRAMRRRIGRRFRREVTKQAMKTRRTHG